jgi:glycosyltransferase involved in cell wall biosynthesis
MMNQTVLPISAVIPTRHRPLPLRRCLESLIDQGCLPAEVVVVDGSTDNASRKLVEDWALRVTSQCVVVWKAADQLGAAAQRNQGITVATQPFVCFFDDDILFEPDCMSRLWDALQSDSTIGGVNAMIVNQRYQPPGLISRLFFTLMHGRSEISFAGRVIGPAINLLPEDRDDLPEVVQVEWLNLGCTLYREEALPSPLFNSIFRGYSLMEDLTLSLRVGKCWKLANVRTARIFHDSQPGDHKSSITDLARMELVNRLFVMTQVLHRKRLSDYFKFLVLQGFIIASSFNTREWYRVVPLVVIGKLRGLGYVMLRGKTCLSSR